MGIDRKDVLLGISVLQNAGINKRLSETRDILQQGEQRQNVQAYLKKVAYEANKALKGIIDRDEKDALKKYIEALVIKNMIATSRADFEKLEEIQDRAFADKLIQDLDQCESISSEEAGEDAEEFVRILHEYSAIAHQIESLREKREQGEEFINNAPENPDPISPSFVRNLYSTVLGKILYWIVFYFSIATIIGWFFVMRWAIRYHRNVRLRREYLEYQENVQYILPQMAKIPEELEPLEIQAEKWMERLQDYEEIHPGILEVVGISS